ncbi:MAG: flagellar motor protein MotB [Myxococcota bacterium]
MRRDRRGHRRSRDRSEAVSTERWAVSYADLVTLLFAFFTTLYAMSNVDEAKVDELEDAVRNAFAHDAPPPPVQTPPPARCITEPIPPLVDQPRPPPVVDPRTALETARREARRRLEERLLAMLTDPALAGRVDLTPDPRGVRLTLGAAAFFAPGDSRLRAEAAEALRVLGATLARHPGAIVVEGHTDDTPVRGGPFRSNWELSTARATEVLALLVDEHDVSPERLAAAGYAEHRAIADNDTPQGRARNRRVDIVVIPADPSPEGQPDSNRPQETVQ